MLDRRQAGDIRKLAAGLILLLFGMPALARQDSDSPPLFEHQTTLHVRIEGPLSTLQKERSDTEYLDGKLSYVDESGASHEFDLKFRARGNYRRQRKTCWFPPVRLKFDAGQVVDTEFAGQRILKLVSHCSPGQTNFEQLVLKEQLAYRILQLHTPYSFRTRLLRISWVDTDEKDSTTEKYGFLIEHKNHLENRLAVSIADFSATKHSKLDASQAALITIFQYLIGNTDFSLIQGASGEACCHNGILVSKTDGAFFPIPYDFDFAGIVNAPYAEPNPKLPIKSVTKRFYRGSCSVNSELATTISMFAERQQAVFDLIASQEGLTEKYRKRAQKFVQKFYDEIANPTQAEQYFAKKCS